MKGITAFALLALHLGFASAIAQSARPAPAGQLPAGWHHEGSGSVRVEGDEIVISAPAPGPPSQLVFDRALQDVGVRLLFRCPDPCSAGLIARKVTAEAGSGGYYTSLAAADPGIMYRINLDPAGRELGRKQLPEGVNMPSTQAGRGGGAAGPAPPVLRPPDPANLPPAKHVPGNGWNDAQIYVRGDRMSGHLNRARLGGDRGAGLYEGEAFGQVVLHVAAGELRVKIREVGDLTEIDTLAPEVVSHRFELRKLTDLFYAEGVAVGDINRDGHIDVVAGPNYYLGPDFKKAREIFHVAPLTPNAYGVGLTQIDDFNGDGWPDVLNGAQLYINPKGVPRHWQSYNAAQGARGEINLLEDVDGDRKRDYVALFDGRVGYFKPSADGISPWTFVPVSEKGAWGSHGLGVGDINGDGRMDILKGYDNNGTFVAELSGWFEQPAAGQAGPWRFHSAPFGGGAKMFAYDVNGDKLADVVTAKYAHGWGLAWFEQRRTATGEISFVEHTIMDDSEGRATYGAAFSGLHALDMADIDGDGLQDIVTGKRWMAHNDTFTDPEAFAPAVLYWFRLTRKAGTASFTPELIHNDSGVGNQVIATDINGDRRPDVITATKKGAFIFLNKAGGRDATGSPVPRAK